MTTHTAQSLIEELRRQGGILTLDGDRLRCRAPQGVLTAEVLARLKEHKQEIIAALRAEADSAPESATVLARIPRQDPLPLSFGQERLWFLYSLEPGAPAFNLSSSIRFRERIDADILERAIHEIARRHEMFRTRLEDHQGRPVPKIDSESKLTLSVLELSRREELQPGEIEHLLREEARRPFDLGTGPLARFVLLRLGDAEDILQTTAHHIIADHWSGAILGRDIARVYEAFTVGQPSPLTDDQAIDYVDFAHWQRQALIGDGGAVQLDYWRQQLAGSPSVDLPTDRPRPAIQSSSGRNESTLVSRALTARVNGLARSEKATLFMTLLAAFQVLLHRYTGQDDLVVGSPISGRKRVELEQIIGYFVNNLVLRTDVSGDPTFRELLQRVKQVTLKAFAHQDTPFASLVESLRPERDLSRSPLFQILFDLDNTPEQAREDWHRVAVIERVDVGTANLDLAVFAATHPDGIELRWEYCTDLFDRGTILRFMEHFQVVLESVVADPERPISQLEILGGLERRRVLVEWNDSELATSSTQTVHRILSRQAARTPDRVAVSAAGEEMTYAELDTRANRLANHLRQLGAGPGTLVGLCLNRSLDLVVGIVGVLKSGAAYLPLDPTYPSSRLGFMLDSSGAPLLVAHSELLDRLPAHGARVVCLDTDSEAIGTASAEEPDDEARPTDLAYTIYTSGSTGVPKGVQIEHRTVVNFLRTMARRPGLEESDTLLAVTTLSFDISVLELLLPLAVGARVAVASPEVAGSGPDLWEAIRDSGATIMQATPATWQLLLQTAGENDRLPGRILCGGEALPTELAERLLPRCDELWNMYGPTEATVWATVQSVETGCQTAVQPIGRPIGNTTIYILDRHLQPVPIGVPGDLYIGGSGLARGYLGQPALTAERFVPDPFVGRGRDRLYFTGDRARYLADGTIEFLGRSDFQVKVRGFRIELGEIESALGEHPAIGQAVVVVRGTEEKHLVAYLVAAGADAIPNVSQLRDFLAGRLPQYMVPSQYVPLDSLPLTPNGKVDRNALPEPEALRPELEHRYVEPGSETEASLVAIWQRVLGIDQVGINDNFFDLGGHSLLGTQVISRLNETFGVNLSLRVLFEKPTVAGLASSIAAAPGRDGLPQLSTVDRDHDLVLSSSQQRLWFLTQLEPQSPWFNLPSTSRLLGRLDIEVLRWVLEHLLQRHEALRTRFASTDGAPRQIVEDAISLELPIIDLQDLPEHERRAEATRLAREDAQRPFDIAVAPLFRCSLLKLGDSEHWLVLNAHHIVSDDWSGGIFVEEFSALYEARAAGNPIALPPLPIQYPDFADWQRQIQDSPVMADQLTYWTGRLAGSPAVLNLPADRPRPAIQTFRGRVKTLELPAELIADLRQLGQQEGATLFMTLLAAFKVLLYRLTNQDDILVGTPIANRNRSEIEGLIGLFVNTLVLRSDLGGDPVFRDLLAQIRETALEAYDHQDLPFDRLVEELQPERDLSHAPLFQTMFILENRPAEAIDLPDLSIRREEIHSGTSKFDLSLYIGERDGGARATLEFSSDLFDDATMDRFLAQYRLLLESIAAQPERRLSELELLTEAEQIQILETWNDTDRDYPTTPCLHELIEQQVDRTPDLPAVIFGDQTLTYREFDERANRLARHLRDLGVGPEVTVGVYLQRSLEMIVALHAVLKAGGGYVPLDPDYPADRLRYMVTDSAASVILTQADLIDGLPENDAETVVLDAEWDRIATQSADRLPLLTTPSNLAYIIYTSGSTGRPKGVENAHRGIVNRLLWMQEAFGIDSSDRVLQKTPSSFDVSVWEFFWPFMTGAALVVARPGGHKDGAYLVDLIQRQAVTTLHFVPSMLRVFLEEGGVESCTGLKRVICSGEALPHEMQERFFERLDSAELHNLYGPTEAAVDVTWWACRRDDTRNVVPIGKPIANTQTYILDPALRPVPIGVAGELYLGGVQVARGYRNRPDLTAGRFVPDPFRRPEGRLYRTGDLTRYLPDGNIEFLGRTDFQVKIRGFRIELGEIEALLDQHPGVRQVVVVAREDSPGDKRLVAYVAAVSPQPGIAELRTFLGGSLPDYMVPAAFVFLDELPLMPNGKVDRRALPAPDTSRPDLDHRYVAPRSDAESRLADIWESVLRVDRIGVNDNFFELGGDSILSIQVISRANDAGLKLQPRQIFQHQTIAELAAVAGIGGPLFAEQGEITGPVPLTPIQAWFFERQLAEPHHFNQAALWSTRERLDPQLVERALEQLVTHHDALRLRFTAGGGGWRQENGPIGPPAFEVHDLSAQPPARWAEAIQAVADLQQRSLDLGSGPVARFVLLDGGDSGGSRLLTVIHHLAVDVVSWRILLEDTERLYRQLQAGEEPQLASKTTSFKAWAEGLQSYAATDGVQTLQEYWLQVVAQPTAALPRDEEGEATQESAQSLAAELDADATSQLLREAPKAYKTQINDLLLAALANALCDWTGGADLLVDFESHGRVELDERMDLTRTVGWFTSLYPVRLHRAGGDLGEHIMATKETLRAVPEIGLSYGLLRYADGTDGEESLATPAAPEILFNYGGQLDRGDEMGSLFAPASEPIGAMRSPMGTLSHPIEINASVADGRLRCEWTWSLNQYRQETIRQLAEQMIERLREVLSHCLSTEQGSFTPSDFPLADLGAGDLDQLAALLDDDDS